MPKDDQRPTDPMTAADALKLAEEVRKTIQEEIRPISNRLANMQRSLIDVFGILESLSTSLTETRVRRLEEELFEVDQEREILEKRLHIVAAKKEMKKSDTPAAIDTNERVKRLAESTYLERERLEEEKRADWWRDTFRQAGRTIIITLSVSGVLGLAGFLWWLFQLYVSR